jgi:hypothetical protein
LSTDFNANTFIPYLSAGTSNWEVVLFWNIGYGYMTNNYSDYLKFTAEVGYTSKRALILALDTKTLL